MTPEEHAKKLGRKLRLFAEAVRDIGILLLVFGPLEGLLKTVGQITTKEWYFAVGSMIVGGLLIWLGVEVGSKYDL